MNEQSRKRLTRLIILATLAGLVIFATGCPELMSTGTTTKTERLSQFVEALNDGLSNNNIDEHIHPDANDYNALKDESTLEGTALDASSNGTFRIDNVEEETDDSLVGDWTNDSATQTFTAEMKEELPGNWKILSFSVGGSRIFD